MIGTTRDAESRLGGGSRSIGPAGAVARLLVGTLMVGSAVVGQMATGWRPGSWALGLVGFPLGVLFWQWWRARGSPARLDGTGPVAYVTNIAVDAALYLTPWYAPALSVTSYAALLFYGSSMFLAAARGYAGCEVLALSNLVLGRDDQVGYVLFSPLDAAERARRRLRRPDAGVPPPPGRVIAARPASHQPGRRSMTRWAATRK